MSDPTSRAGRTNRRHRQTQIRRRRAVVLLALVLVVAALVVTLSSGSSPPPRSSTSSSTSTSTTSATASASGSASGSSTARVSPGAGTHRGRTTALGPPSLEAGIEPWQLAAPLSREALVAVGGRLRILGGLSPSGSSLNGASWLDPASGTVTPAGTLATVVHDGAGAQIGATSYVFGGGSPDTFATVQSLGAGAGAGAVAGHLPQPRSDLATAAIGRTVYIVGGYDGTTYDPSVLATTDGSRFTSVANLPVPARYPAVVALGGHVFAFGGQTGSGAGSAVTATADIQEIDPATHSAHVVGTLPQALYGAAAFVIDGHIYLAGGQTGSGQTLTQLYEFDQRTHRVADAGLLPQAVAFGGYATVGTGKAAIGYLVGGEVAQQSGTDQAGMATGTLASVISLRPSSYGGPVGGADAGAPYQGHLLIADRGNDRLLVIDAARTLQWQYPSATMPPPPGGFYFPDDAFFFHKGTGIISNQEDNHTIVEIGYPSGKLLWQYGHPGKPGTTAGYLNQPDDAYLLKNGEITVADAMNDRILFISPSGTPLSQIGTNGVAVHNPPTGVGYPNGDTPLANGNVLVSEINGSWITEYTPGGQLVWTVQLRTVNYPSDPQQVGSNLYLLADYDPPAEGRILTIRRSGAVVWKYDVLSGDGMLKKPSLAEQLPNGLIMANDDYRNRVVVIDPRDDSIVWQYGLTDTSGTAPGMLSIPDGFDLLLANGTTPTHPQTG
ncbi:MAG TPA: PQQ-binding-like beta-propeller repeat protein [Acidimicrobiales bacterium]